MTRSQRAQHFLIAFLIGATALQWFQNRTTLLWIEIGVVGGLIVMLATRMKQDRVFAIFLGASAAIGTVFLHTHPETERHITRYAIDERVTLTGIVVDEPDRRPLDTRYTLRIDTLETASGHMLSSLQGNVLVVDMSGQEDFLYGDTLHVTGTLELPGEIDGFSYQNYLKRYGIYAVMYRGNVERIRTGNWSILGTLYSLKATCEGRINRLLPEPHASFMAGLLTGTRRGIPKDLTEVFAITGLTHIIAISGYNISMIIAIIGNLLFWLPLQKRFLPSVIAVTLFTVFVGASAAVVRAAIMGILGLTAMRLGRQQHARLTVLWTACIMIAWNPLQLWYDAGFQLSFAAVVGLMEISPYLAPLCRYVPETCGMRESLQMTLSAQIATLPLSILLFNRFSIIAPLANLLAAPLLPIAMLLGVVAVVLSLISQTLGLLIAFLAWLPLQWIITTATLLSRIPLASTTMNTRSFLVLLGSVAVLFIASRTLLPLVQKQFSRAE